MDPRATTSNPVKPSMLTSLTINNKPLSIRLPNCLNPLESRSRSASMEPVDFFRSRVEGKIDLALLQVIVGTAGKTGTGQLSFEVSHSLAEGSDQGVLSWQLSVVAIAANPVDDVGLV